jgi:hypothetical protein
MGRLVTVLLASAPSRRAPGSVDRISPGDIPIAQPVQFDFVVDPCSAKAHGLPIRPAGLAQAYEVID